MTLRKWINSVPHSELERLHHTFYVAMLTTKSDVDAKLCIRAVDLIRSRARRACKTQSVYATRGAR